MWRLIFSKKNSSQAKSELERKLSKFNFRCGASTSDMDLPDELSDVHFRDLRCENRVEKLNYSMGCEQRMILIQVRIIILFACHVMHVKEPVFKK